MLSPFPTIRPSRSLTAPRTSSLRKEARAALLASKHALEEQSRSQREELLRSPALREKSTSSTSEKSTFVHTRISPPIQLTLPVHSEDALIHANRTVTESLQRTVGLMQKELERSVLSTQLLGKSSPFSASFRSILTIIR